MTTISSSIQNYVDFKPSSLKSQDENDFKRDTTNNSELEILVKRKQDEVTRKARHHWGLLRESVWAVTKRVEESDIKDLVLSHGIHRERKLNHHKNIIQVLHIPEYKEYLTFDGQAFRFFHEDGLKKDVSQPEVKINRVVFCKETNQFVGWLQDQSDLYLMSKEFVVASQSKAVGNILIGVYNEKKGEMITVGPYFITSWSFRYGARYLTPRKTTMTNFGGDQMFTDMVLEETASKSQRMFFILGCGLVVYNVFSGLEVCRKKDLHNQPITALVFFNPLKYLITGAKDGCIKVWDGNWKVQMVFVGHSKAINFLRIYPYGSAFISASLDCTIRVWSMETFDEIDKTVVSEPVEGMGTQTDYDIIYTHAGRRVDLWRLQHLLQMHTNIGYRVTRIKTTDHPCFPRRAVLLCRDSSVRLVCPANGEVITTLLMKPTDGLVDAAYAIAEDLLFALMANGDIVKAATDQNPCHVLDRWKCNTPTEMCVCLLLYEYVVDPTETKTPGTPKAGAVKNNRNRTLLLGGRKDGSICVFNWHTGEITFTVSAHGDKGVISMVSNTKHDQLITAGKDNIIKIWRVYPFAEEALAPVLSFYCAHTPSHMSVVKTNLCVAFQDISTATYSIVLYNLLDNSRNDHRPDDDHMDNITSLSSCPRMKIYASSSMDGTIHIWNHNNVLIRLLKINTIPHSVAFCSSKGDLLVGVNNHLYFISHTKYLPRSYRRKQVCMKFLPTKTEEPIEYSENRLRAMDKTDVNRLKHAHASFRFSHFVDILSPEEEDAIMQEKIIKEKAYGLLEMRENEIEQIRDGALITHNKPKPSKRTQNKAFKEYMKIYYNKERIKLPKDEEFPRDSVKKKLDQELKAFEGNVKEEEKKYRPESPPLGFFAELGQMRQMSDPLSTHACFPTHLSGYLPNSVLLKILYPPPQPKEEELVKAPYQPPKLTRKQLAEIQSLYPRRTIRVDSDDLEPEISRTVTFDEHVTRVLQVDLSDDEEEKTADSESVFQSRESTDAKMKDTPSVKSPASTEKSASVLSGPQRTSSSLIQQRMLQLKKKKTVQIKDPESSDEEDMFAKGSNSQKSSLMSRVQEIMEKPPPVKEVTEPVKKMATPPPVEPIKRLAPVPAKPVIKLISQPPKPQPVAPRSPTPPPPPTPLPNFIKQFVGTEWFDKYFPNCNENTLPKPWTGDLLVNMIVKLLRIAEWLHKIAVTEAILTIYNSEGLSDSVTLTVVKTLLSVLNHHANPPNCGVGEQKDFILTALRALSAFAVRDKDVIAELIAQFLDGDMVVRSAVLEVMASLGMVDPHRQFQKELDTWDIWSFDEKTHAEEVRKMVHNWLDRWMTAYKMRIEDTVEKLNKGQSLQGRLSTVASDRKGSVRPGDVETSSKHGSLKVPESSRTGRTSSMSYNSVTVTLDKVNGSSIMESVTYIDAISYFCEVMMEKELEALKRGEVFRSKEGEVVTQNKNTVLVLPKIAHKPALTRLGETHTSKCRADRETSLHTEFRMPPIIARGKQLAPGTLTGFVSCINLPMKSVHLNPFPSPADLHRALLQQPILITLKSAQKYFIPSQSYVDDYPTSSLVV
ncbi:WD repeat-containing protein 97-like isoform X2 [Physella acuta]|uniref:WD repeat-containing protein 97-like isoform X2 n=1 Tax=Physella acuta TaxID=109671 RepID=UPI0027DABF85|nr:WD repeat-containing protein 97-like isoform X2 [Physella acuta]